MPTKDIEQSKEEIVKTLLKPIIKAYGITAVWNAFYDLNPNFLDGVKIDPHSFELKFGDQIIADLEYQINDIIGDNQSDIDINDIEPDRDESRD